MKTEILQRYKEDLEAKLKTIEGSASPLTSAFRLRLNQMPMAMQYYEAARKAVIKELQQEIADVQTELTLLYGNRPSTSA